MKSYRIAFFGTPRFAASLLETLRAIPNVVVPVVVTQEDKPTGRGKVLTPPPVKIVADQHRIPVLQPTSIKNNTVDFLNAFQDFAPFDGALVVAFGQILPVALLSIPTFGFVNVHTSKLPRWRGAAPIQRALMQGDSITATTLMKMEAGLDTGGIYAETLVPIDQEMTGDILHDRLLEESSLLLQHSLIDIFSGRMAPIPQAEDGVTYAQKIKNEEAQINFKLSALEIHNHVRGLCSIPGAFTFVYGKRLKIFGTRVVEESSSNGSPGEIIAASPSEVLVQCGKGILGIEEIQLEGKKRIKDTTQLLSATRLG